MSKDEEFARMVNEALKEINIYLKSVYDMAQDVYLEEKEVMAVKAATMLMEKARLSSVGERLGLGGVLGRLIKANQSKIGDELLGECASFENESWNELKQ
nr:hypothetical protein Iba_chr02bCG25300 [Ipomoea batatas]